MSKKLSLFIFIDALGFEVLKRNPHFLEGYERKPLRTILGYSSACDPSIISGLMPSQHGHFSCFYYSPSTCPYPWIKWFKFLPPFFRDHHRVRHLISQYVAKRCHISGYFQLYNVPFDLLPLFDYSEKRWMWDPNGLIHGKSIIDLLCEKGIPYYVKGPHTSEERQWQELEKDIESGKIAFAYLFLGKLDALMHAKGPFDASIEKLLKEFDEKIREVIAKAKMSYDIVEWTVFSDHGMHKVEKAIDLISIIESIGLKVGKDYIAMYDSTMVRLWYFNEESRRKIQDALKRVSVGRFLSDEELKELGIYFPDRKYGHEIYLIVAPYLIIPSFMGKKLIPGMHGYHPDDKDSYASIISNQSIPENIKGIEQIFQLMMSAVS